MDNGVRRIFVEKKQAFAVSARDLCDDIRENLGIQGLKDLRIVNRYDVSGISEEEYLASRSTIFSEPTVDIVYDEILPLDKETRAFAIEYLPGQFDQRADSAAQCIQILTQKERPVVKSAKVIILNGVISDEEFANIKSYCINPLESREARSRKPETLEEPAVMPPDVPEVKGFITLENAGLRGFMDEMGFAMSLEDLAFCQDYFREKEKRNPTVAELRVIDTYWSDHCRHTTFLTKIEKAGIEAHPFNEAVQEAYGMYKASRAYVYGERMKDQCLMDIAVIAMKELHKRGELADLELSEEVNACSIVVETDINGQKEEWLVMFKNETHNHPTEIEPFGGAATCLGGAIRDPLSGRSYVYGAMRVTGSADPRAKVEDTLAGKLPQRKITTGAAAGYSSYGNQIGLATGQVTEIYDENFVAKRMEIGAVIGAAPKANVTRKSPEAGDVIILLGGRTGRDGCGGATGSSKEHTEESLLVCGAEVQKGNAPTERKIQRLFRNPEVSRMIKKCNDFGAGGVSVAIGELADGLDIQLNRVPKKYEGLDGTELAISESQERMAVVVAPADAGRFMALAGEENLESVAVAAVTASSRLRMYWRENAIVDISREFLNTNGIQQKTEVVVAAPTGESALQKLPEGIGSNASDIKEAWLANLQDLNVCSQKGLVERFDSTIGSGSVLMPFGGKYQESPAEGLAMKLPVMHAETNTATLMTFGYNPRIGKWSPFHGALYAVVEAVTKIAALGGDYKKTRLTLQEYFEKLGKDPVKWGKPFSALLGAYYAQMKLSIPAIGGKDSMSGTFKDINVPPTLVAFAVNVAEADKIVSQEFKKTGSKVILLPLKRDSRELPDFEQLESNLAGVHQLVRKQMVLSAGTVKYGGVAAAISKMCFGNRIGFAFEADMDLQGLFAAEYGSVLLEVEKDFDEKEHLTGIDCRTLGFTQEKPVITVGETEIGLAEALSAWRKPLEKVFPTKTEEIGGIPRSEDFTSRSGSRPAVRLAKPRILIPVFPGTNCEYDTARAFERAGGEAEILVIRNLNGSDIEASMTALAKGIGHAQIVALPGGFSAGDEPEGSGKFIATAFRNPWVKEAVMELLKQRDGLMLGICNGFQALIKLGLLPYGEIRDIDENCPTLTYNKIGRHVSCLVQTRISSTLSPWFSKVNAGDIHSIAVSHGEGRFAANPEVAAQLFRNGQVATQYVDPSGNPTYDIAFNPNGSIDAIEGITSPDGRVLGKMGHSERAGASVHKNVPGEKYQKLFEAGVDYFR